MNPNDDHGSDSFCRCCEKPLPPSRTKPQLWCSDACRMHVHRAREDTALAALAVEVLGPGIFTERELANRVRLLARRDPSLQRMVDDVRSEVGR